MSRRTEDPVIARFTSHVRQALGDKIAAIRWFGSRAHGRGNEDSDYDLLLELRGSLTEGERDVIADIAVDVSADYGVLLDIHHRTVDQVHKHPYSFSPFMQSVMNEGVMV